MNIYKYLWFFGQKPVDSTATLYPSNKKVFVKSNQSLLAAALEQGLDWPHDCKFGSCTSCKAKLVKGKIKPTSDYSQVLTKEEFDFGLSYLANKPSRVSNIDHFSLSFDGKSSFPS